MLNITPLDLDGWASRDAARRELPVLVRRLIHARPASISNIDFPAFETTTEGGWDGRLTATGTDTWVPNGASFWELTCEGRSRVAGKATDDYRKRTAATDKDIRESAVFVFVSGRRWPGKEKWQRARMAEGQWAEVRAYDADTLSAWLELAPSAHAWMNGRLGRSLDDVCASDDVWTEWAGASAPRLPPSAFLEAIDESDQRLRAFLAGSPSSPFVVAGETRSEAAAFVAAALMDQRFAAAGERLVVARSTAGLQWIKAHGEGAVVLVGTQDLELALGDLPSRTHVIVATDRSSDDRSAAAVIEPLTWEAFRRLVGELGIDEDERERLEHESGYRMGILRRRLSRIPAVRVPEWAGKTDLAKPLLGLALAGGWYWQRPGDREVLCALTQQDEASLERSIRQLATLGDAPIFSVGDAGGVVSRPDAFDALRGQVTRGDLERFFEQIRTVLGEPDPALELEEEKRWAANIYGKERRYSGTLRRQIAETATFLAVSGRGLFGGTIAFDCASAAARLVRDLFARQDDFTWFHLRDVLRSLAEAAPDDFLTALERDLPHEAIDQGVWKTIKPTKGTTNENYRASLLWALERLAWDSNRFPRAANALAALATRPLDDNWVNKPEHSLYTCLHPWLAQTAASVESRIRVLNALDRSYPQVTWPLALKIIDQRLGHASYADRPRYRRDAVGHGHRPTADDRRIIPAATELVLGREGKSLAQIQELIRKSPCFDGPDLARLWDVVEQWAQSASESDVAVVREGIRQIALRRQRSKRTPYTDVRARALFKSLKPAAPANRHAWLFQSTWVEYGSDELEVENLDHAARERRIEEERKGALRELWEEGGLSSIVAFARSVGAPHLVGHVAARSFPNFPAERVVRLVADADLDAWEQRELFLRGALDALDEDRCTAVLRSFREEWNDRRDLMVKLLCAAPARLSTWNVLDGLSPDDELAYWRSLNHLNYTDDPVILERLCRGFLAAGRATVAFRQAGFHEELLPSQLLIDILKAVAYVPSSTEETWPLQSHSVEDFFEVLDKRDDYDKQDLLGLEFIYVDHLDDTPRGVSAMSKEIAADPSLVAVAVRSIYRRGEGEDEPDQVDPKIAAQNANHWYSVMHQAKLPPASDAEGQIDPTRIAQWMQRARELLVECGRLDSGERVIGELIGRTIKEIDEMWPPRSVAEALDPFVSEHLAQGINRGIANSRGAVWRGPDGAQERVLATKYRKWAGAIMVEAPRLAQALEEVAKSYDHEAEHWDTEAKLKRRAPHGR